MLAGSMLLIGVGDAAWDAYLRNVDPTMATASLTLDAAECARVLGGHQRSVDPCTIRAPVRFYGKDGRIGLVIDGQEMVFPLTQMRYVEFGPIDAR